MMALVRDVIFASICETSMHHVSGSQSTKTGMQSRSIIGKAQEIMVKDGMMTSSPGFKSMQPIATCKAVVPLLTAIPYFMPQYSAHFASNSSMKRPAEDIQPV